jgi:hypothetical protein
VTHSLATVDAEQARGRLYQLHGDLKSLIDKDPEQEVQGWAVPVLDAVLQTAKDVFPAGEPAVAKLRDVMSPEAVASGESVRAVDLYLVVGQLLAAIPHRPTRLPRPDWLG